MLPDNPNQRIFVAIKSLDFRKGIDGIVAVCRQQFQLDPRSGHYFIFRNRRKTAIKILIFDNQGFWLCHKRLSRGRFHRWPTEMDIVEEIPKIKLQALVYNDYT